MARKYHIHQCTVKGKSYSHKIAVDHRSDFGDDEHAKELATYKAQMTEYRSASKQIKQAGGYIKKRGKKLTITAVGALSLIGLFMLIPGVLFTHTGDINCSDTCVSYINVTSQLYDVKFAPGVQPLDFSPEHDLASYTLQRSERGDWVDFNIGGHTLKRGQTWELKVIGEKNPRETLKWGFKAGKDYLDPLWIGDGQPDKIGNFDIAPLEDRISIKDDYSEILAAPVVSTESIGQENYINVYCNDENGCDSELLIGFEELPDTLDLYVWDSRDQKTTRDIIVTNTYECNVPFTLTDTAYCDNYTIDDTYENITFEFTRQIDAYTVERDIDSIQTYTHEVDAWYISEPNGNIYQDNLTWKAWDIGLEQWDEVDFKLKYLPSNDKGEYWIELKDTLTPEKSTLLDPYWSATNATWANASVEPESPAEMVLM